MNENALTVVMIMIKWLIRVPTMMERPSDAAGVHFLRLSFTTYEKVDTIPLMVIKRGGERELFDRDKIVNGMLRACEKRPISVDVINNVRGKLKITCQAV